jgi:hypothetical protein
MKCPKNKICPKQPGNVPVSFLKGKELCKKCDKPVKDKIIKQIETLNRTDDIKIRQALNYIYNLDDVSKEIEDIKVLLSEDCFDKLPEWLTRYR